MTKRIFRGVALTALIAVTLVFACVTLTLYGTYEAQTRDALKAEAGYILHALARETDEAHWFAGFSSVNRVTLVAPDGAVLYDNAVDAGKLENHLDRPEIAAAISAGSGEDKRYSKTLSETTLYYAARTDDGNVLRISNTRSSILGLLLRMVTMFALIIAGVALLSLVMARHIARRIVAPLNALDLDRPLANTVYDELSPLLVRMERQNAKIAEQLAALSEKQTELTAITENMREGLVLLDRNGAVLYINGSAASIFGADARARIGGDILSVTRDAAVNGAVKSALCGNSADAAFTRDGRAVRALASPVLQDGEAAGVVLLLLDITEKQLAEASRREFTANVSHELKTPLTSIVGYAEIMRDGVARPEDTKAFSARIYDEANRLIALVNDILALSRLDERKGLGEMTSVPLLPLAQGVARRLAPLAKEKGVRLSVEGTDATVSGYRTLLDEMVTNLADNAVKYTDAGGSVLITVQNENGKPALAVRDTGIGIPKEDQPHVFERFYRVDKSHSKATGGTGLGLSIVKHGAALHGAKLTLHSEPGQGTCVRLWFP